MYCFIYKNIYTTNGIVVVMATNSTIADQILKNEYVGSFDLVAVVDTSNGNSKNINI